MYCGATSTSWSAKGLDPGTIIELLCYATINMIPMALPLATLLAAIMTMGNLGEKLRAARYEVGGDVAA